LRVGTWPGRRPRPGPPFRDFSPDFIGVSKLLSYFGASEILPVLHFNSSAKVFMVSNGIVMFAVSGFEVRILFGSISRIDASITWKQNFPSETKEIYLVVILFELMNKMSLTKNCFKVNLRLSRYTKAARTVPRRQHRKPSAVRVFSTALDLVYGSDAWREGVWPFLSLRRGVISLRGKREHRIYVMYLTVRVLIRWMMVRLVSSNLPKSESPH